MTPVAESVKPDPRFEPNMWAMALIGVTNVNE
jgi:hypothetical protein